MFGKEKCKMLRQIRQKIAEENDIVLVTKECTHKGECRGTCPACEAELRYLEQELARRQALGKKVAVAALAAGMTFTTTGCLLKDAAIDLLTDVISDQITTGMVIAPTVEVLEGEVPYTEPIEELAGDLIEEASEASDG